MTMKSSLKLTAVSVGVATLAFTACNKKSDDNKPTANESSKKDGTEKDPKIVKNLSVKTDRKIPLGGCATLDISVTDQNGKNVKISASSGAITISLDADSENKFTLLDSGEICTVNENNAGSNGKSKQITTLADKAKVAVVYSAGSAPLIGNATIDVEKAEVISSLTLLNPATEGSKLVENAEKALKSLPATKASNTSTMLDAGYKDKTKLEKSLFVKNLINGRTTSKVEYKSDTLELISLVNEIKNEFNSYAANIGNIGSQPAGMSGGVQKTAAELNKNNAAAYLQAITADANYLTSGNPAQNQARAAVKSALEKIGSLTDKYNLLDLASKSVTSYSVLGTTLISDVIDPEYAPVVEANNSIKEINITEALENLFNALDYINKNKAKFDGAKFTIPAGDISAQFEINATLVHGKPRSITKSDKVVLTDENDKVIEVKSATKNIGNKVHTYFTFNAPNLKSDSIKRYKLTVNGFSTNFDVQVTDPVITKLSLDGLKDDVLSFIGLHSFVIKAHYTNGVIKKLAEEKDDLDITVTSSSLDIRISKPTFKAKESALEFSATSESKDLNPYKIEISISKNSTVLGNYAVEFFVVNKPATLTAKIDAPEFDDKGNKKAAAFVNKIPVGGALLGNNSDYCATVREASYTIGSPGTVHKLGSTDLNKLKISLPENETNFEIRGDKFICAKSNAAVGSKTNVTATYGSLKFATVALEAAAPIETNLLVVNKDADRSSISFKDEEKPAIELGILMSDLRTLSSQKANLSTQFTLESSNPDIVNFEFDKKWMLKAGTSARTLKIGQEYNVVIKPVAADGYQIVNASSEFSKDDVKTSAFDVTYKKTK